MVTPPLSTLAAEKVLRAQRVPWLTLAVAALAVLAYFSATAATALVGERERVLSGELWRLWTAHVVHFGASHLAWNLLVTIAAGAWIERIEPVRTRIVCGLGGPLITAAAFMIPPGLHVYGGLSGLATALVVLLAVSLLRQGGKRGAWPAWGLLGLMAAKIAWELTKQTTFFAHFDQPGVRPAPVAHLAGAILGVMLAFIPRTR